MNNKSDEMSSNICLPPNIGTLPARLQKKIISVTDPVKKYATGKEGAISAHSPKANCGGRREKAAGVLSVNVNLFQKPATVAKKSAPTYFNNSRSYHPPEPSKNAKWLDPKYVNTKNGNLISYIEIIKSIEQDFHALVEDRTFLEKWDTYCRLRTTLQKVFRKMLVEELKFCCKENVEQYFWKLLYYSSIETLKKSGMFSPSNGTKALELINEGLLFYEELLGLLQLEQVVTKVDTLDDRCFNSTNGVLDTGANHKADILAKVSAQKLLINLGDLSRYKEQIEMTGSFKQAREYYERAQQLLPTNGIPYNQLAILSIYSKKKFDAVYYHMRSLMASNPIHSAKESLKVLFDEIRKKQETSSPKETESKNQSNGVPMRREIWIHPDGSRQLHRLPANHRNRHGTDTEENLKNLDPIQLSKRFLLSFLNVQGKLFTGIGMDTFDCVTNQMVKEFDILLSYTPLTFTYQRLLQIISLNIFSVCYNNRDEIKEQKKEIRIQAFTIGSIMFGIILNRINSVLEKLCEIESNESTKVLKLDAKPEDEINSIPCSPKHTNVKQNLPEDVRTLISVVKVWSNWLINYDDVQNSSGSCINLDKLRQLNLDPWKSFAKFCNLINPKSKSDEIFSQMQVSDGVSIQMDEDTYLKGFAPLKLNENDLIWCHRKCDVEYAKTLFRIEKILMFANTLCDFGTPFIKKIAIDTDCVIFIRSTVYSEEQSVGDENNLDVQEDFEEISTDEDISNEFSAKTSLNSASDNVYNSENPEISDLIRRKNELEKKHRMQEMYQKTLQGALHKSGISLHIEVRPRHLVPDTNCFIDFLDQIKMIATNSDKYYIFVPLTVVNELEGLSKGARDSPNMLATAVENDSNLQFVTRRSKEALEFIRSKNSGIRCVTTKGSILNSSVFTLEESENQMSNDDKILLTALNLCKNNIDRSADGIHYIETEVVLLTKDRNLRVKALSRNLSVSHLSGFLKWAGYAV